MSPIRLGPNDFLQYEPSYGVLICRDCQYAIQKSAIQSHLLRHKIYRDERQRLLASIGELTLREPDDVPLPATTSAPIDALPIISGYCCTISGCGNLCASSKRMRRHRNEVHGLNEPCALTSFSRPVNIQTFFRGTKLRYFEVAGSPRANGVDTVLLDARSRAEAETERYEEEAIEEHMDTHMLTPQPSPPHGVSPGNLFESGSLVDLDTLNYFYHFITTTSLTLPSGAPVQPPTHYWKDYIVSLSLQHRWLMCGILAISACHLAVITDSLDMAQMHCERSSRFGFEFSVGCEEADGEIKRAGDQVQRILLCSTWANTGWSLHRHEAPVASQLHAIITTLRSFAISNAESIFSQDIRHGEDHGQGEAFSRANLVMELYSNSPHSLLLNRLRELPSRMTELFGRPESTRDVLATLAAIGNLVECCSVSFASDDMEGAWRGMTMWLTKIPHHFNQMVLEHNPAALAVLAHWVICLVRRCEQCDCWFLRGAARAIMDQITDLLPSENQALIDLVRNLEQLA